MRDNYLFLDKEEMRRLYHEEGLTCEEVAERMYCSVSTIRKYMRLFGITGRPPKERRPLNRYEINGEMLTAEEIAKRAGVSTSTIRNRIKRGWKGERLLVNSKEAFKIGIEERRQRWY